MEFGAGRGRGSTGFGGASGDVGDVPMALSAHPTALQALESAVALPDAFSRAELARTLRRHNGDVMKAALQLREKHAFRAQHRYEALHVGLAPIQSELRKGYVHFLENAASHDGCPVVLLQLRHFRPSFSSEKLQRQGVGAADGSSSLEDTRRLCVYVLDLAVEAMEEKGADGIVFLLDLGDCALANLEAKMVTDVLQLARRWYPEVARQILVVNASTPMRALAMGVSKLAGERTQRKIRVVEDAAELRFALPAPSLPELYGGQYRMMTPAQWIKLQAEIEQVDLEDARPAEDERRFMTKDARQLNGMQYAACSVEQVVEMKASVLRGPLWRNKSGVAWVKLYAILRPEALLLYESVTGGMPQIIVPVNDQVAVEAAHFADAPRGAFGFRFLVPGVAGGHLLAAGSDAERGNWLQEIQIAIDAAKDEVARERHEEQRRQDEERAFAKLNMISFDDPPPEPPRQQQQHQQHQQQYEQQQQPPVNAVFPSNPMQQQQAMYGGMAMPMQAYGGMMGQPNVGVQQQHQQQQQQFQQVRPPQPVMGSYGAGMMAPGMMNQMGAMPAQGMMPMMPPSAPGFPMGGGQAMPGQQQQQFQGMNYNYNNYNNYNNNSGYRG